jgi:hypothetical protein
MRTVFLKSTVRPCPSVIRPSFEHLQEHIEDIGVCFFHLVKKNDRVGFAAHGLAELAALLVADVAGRRSDQTGDGVLFHVFRHIEADDGSFVVE